MREIFKKEYTHADSEKMHNDYNELLKLISEKAVMLSPGSIVQEFGVHSDIASEFRHYEKASFLMPNQNNPVTLYIECSTHRSVYIRASIDDRFKKGKAEDIEALCNSINDKINT